jgi:hypothetical protein
MSGPVVRIVSSSSMGKEAMRNLIAPASPPREKMKDGPRFTGFSELTAIYRIFRIDRDLQDFKDWGRMENSLFEEAGKFVVYCE